MVAIAVLTSKIDLDVIYSVNHNMGLHDFKVLVLLDADVK